MALSLLVAALVAQVPSSPHVNIWGASCTHNKITQYDLLTSTFTVTSYDPSGVIMIAWITRIGQTQPAEYVTGPVYLPGAEEFQFNIQNLPIVHYSGVRTLHVTVTNMSNGLQTTGTRSFVHP